MWSLAKVHSKKKMKRNSLAVPEIEEDKYG